jgi:V8-like Glu-specific endopeptidase
LDRRSTRPAAARIALALCALIALPAAVAPGVSAGGGAAGAKAADVDAAAAFRAKLGLRSDRAFVTATFGNRAYSAAQWGVPLDQAEAADLAGRAKLQKDLAGALRAWARDPASAGAYIDHRAKGAPVFLTTADPGKARVVVARAIPNGANARFLRVGHSMAELLTLQDRVNADLGAGNLADLGVRSTAIDARANAVAVGVASDTAEVRSALVARYGPAVDVRFEAPAQGGDACTARDDCSPARGGIEIRSSYNNNNCTIGFLVRVAGSPNPRILTAGHCITKSGGTGTSRTWSNDGSQVGWAELGYWTDGADADVGLLSPTSAAVSGARNLLFRASSGDIVPITGWRATAEQIQGALICRSAAVSGYHCGTIELTNRTKDVDGQTIDHQWVVDFDACPGDSGAPYFMGSIAYGIHSDSTVGCEPSTNQAWYSPMGWVFGTLAARGHPVSLCVTASCGADTNVWTQRGSLSQASSGPHLIGLDDGRVLHVGGTAGDLLIVGDGGANAREPQLFDPATGQWSDTATAPWLPADCDGQFAVRLGNGHVLVGGGRNIGTGGADACDGAYVFDPEDGPDGSWTTAASPPVALASAGAALLGDGRALVTGGSGANGATPIAMAYSPGSDGWAMLAAPPTGAFDRLVLALPDGRVLVAGGYTVADLAAPGYADVSAAHLYNPSANSWASTTAVGARGLAGAVLETGRVMVAGGQDLSWDGTQHASFLATVRSFNPATNAWSTLAPLAKARAGAALVELHNGLVLAAAGRIDGPTISGAATRTAEAYDAVRAGWLPAPMLVAAHAEPGGALLADGRVLVAGGGTTATETYVPGDILPPTASAPGFGLRTGASMTASAMPIRVSWSGADSGGAGVGTYDIARSVNGGAFVTIATRVPGTSYNTTGATAHIYRFEVRPRDWADNLGAWVPGTSARLTTLEQTSPKIKYPSPWSTNRSSSYSAGSVRYATAAGRSASYTFTGRGIAFVSARGPSRGSAKIYIDGTQVATVSLYSSTVTYRYVAFQRSWGSSGKHTIKIVVVGTHGHPRVDLDAFEVISNP